MAESNVIKSSQQSPSTTTPPSSSTTSNLVGSEAASGLPSDIPLQPQHTQQQGTYPPVQHSCQPDRKFNVVIYGIEECPKGTPKHERFNRDLENITVISSVDTDGSIQPQSIRDHFRLGKFKNSSQMQQCRPRPIRSACPVSFLGDGYYNNLYLLNPTCPLRSVLVTLL